MSGLMLFAAAKDLIVYRLKSSGASLYWAVDTLERFVGLNQGRSKEFTRGNKPGALRDGSPQRVQGQNMETLVNTYGAVTKIDLR